MSLSVNTNIIHIVKEDSLVQGSKPTEVLVVNSLPKELKDYQQSLYQCFSQLLVCIYIYKYIYIVPLQFPFTCMATVRELSPMEGDGDTTEIQEEYHSHSN